MEVMTAMNNEYVRFRVGKVSSYDAPTCTARVVFDDKDDMVSNPYQLVFPNSLKNRDEIHLDPGEHVVCLCLGNGYETGFVLGAIYDGKNPPTVGDKDRRVTIFDDDMHIFQDRKNHIFQIKDHYGSFILFKDGDIILQSAHFIHLNPHDIPAEDLTGPAHLAAQFD